MWKGYKASTPLSVCPSSQVSTCSPAGKLSKPCSFWVFIEASLMTSLVVQMVKNPPAMQETQVQSLGQEDPPEKGMATQSSFLAWRIPWTEEPGGLPTMGLQRVGHDWETNTHITWRWLIKLNHDWLIESLAIDNWILPPVPLLSPEVRFTPLPVSNPRFFPKVTSIT